MSQPSTDHGHESSEGAMQMRGKGSRQDELALLIGPSQGCRQNLAIVVVQPIKQSDALLCAAHTLHCQMDMQRQL